MIEISGKGTKEFWIRLRGVAKSKSSEEEANKINDKVGKWRTSGQRGHR